MNPYEAALRAFKGDISQLGARWALVGGFAVNARGYGRFTTDIDVVAAVVDDSEAEQLVFRLQRLGYELAAQLEQTAASRLSTVRLRSPHSGETPILVDIIFATTGIESEVVGSAKMEAVFRGLSLPVATLGHLVAMKVLSASEARQHDFLDLQALLAVAGQEDVDETRRALELIESRGFSRGKDLQLEFGNLLEKFPPGQG